jgi:hypothetical protein
MAAQTLPQRSLSDTVIARVPKLYAPTAQAAKRFIEYFAANIRNPNTRRPIVSVRGTHPSAGRLLLPAMWQQFLEAASGLGR